MRRRWALNRLLLQVQGHAPLEVGGLQKKVGGLPCTRALHHSLRSGSGKAPRVVHGLPRT